MPVTAVVGTSGFIESSIFGVTNMVFQQKL